MAIKLRPSFTPKSFLAKVGEDRSIGKCRKDQIVFSQGDPADAVFYIQKGKVKITVVSEQGKEAVVAFLGTNDFFGEGCLAGQLLRMASVATITDSVVVRLEKAAIVRVIHQEPALSEMFIAHLVGRTIRAEADLVDQLFNSSDNRASFATTATPQFIVECRSARRAAHRGLNIRILRTSGHTDMTAVRMM
jgi:CRP/FNR family cyclic AMP-dependent transcriptional regulator